MMKTFSQLLDVPGECWLVGEQINGKENWTVRSADEIHAYSTNKPEVIDEMQSSDAQTIWRALGTERLIVRIWRPHARYKHLADSPARAARHTMRELELVNRKIQAQYLSRLASAGVVIFPDEFTFPVRPEFADDPDGGDPFVREWIEIAKEAIATPGNAAAIVPIPMRVPGEYVDKVRYIDFTPQNDDKIIEKRESAMRKLALELDLPVEIILGTGSRSNHWCVDDTTQALTHDRGWVSQTDLNAGDVILTLNHATGMSEWKPVLDIYRAHVVDEPMVHIEGRRHSSLTTENHRWPIQLGGPQSRYRTWITSGQWAADAHSTGVNKQRHEYMTLAAPNASIPIEAKYSDALVETIAWYSTEGEKGVRPDRNTPKIRIYQSFIVNPDNCARIERALTTLFGPVSNELDKGGRYASPESIARNAEARRLHAAYPQMTIVDIAKRIGVSASITGKYLKQEPKLRDNTPRWRLSKLDNGMNKYIFNSAAAEIILEHAPGRIVNLEFIHNLTLAQLELFIAVSNMGDGHLMHGVTPNFGQKDPNGCDAFELAAILTGRSTNRYQHVGMGISAHGPVEKTQEMICVSDRTTFSPRGRSFTAESYTGLIWCPVTPNGTWFARRNGTVYVTGNSAWQVEESAIKVHLLPTVELICQALTYGYLHPRLLAADEDISNLVVWYDTSELVLRPDRSALARDAYDRIEINGKAYRQAIGFDESATPSDKEAVEMLLKVAARNPTIVFEALSQLVPGSVEVPDTPDAEEVSPSSEPRKDAHERGRPNQPTGEEPPHDKTGKSPGSHAVPTTIPFLGLVIPTDVEGHLLDINSLTREWRILHPKTCAGSKHQCPVSWAGFQHSGIAPGTSGVYTLGCSDGKLELGDRIMPDVHNNGHVTSQVR
jgi:hypothetical protein